MTTVTQPNPQAQDVQAMQQNAQEAATQTYMNSGVVITQEVNGKEEMLGAYPPEAIDEIDNIMPGVVTQPGDKAQVHFFDKANDAMQTREYERTEDGGLMMSETKEGEDSPHMTDYTNAAGESFAAIQPKGSDKAYIYDKQNDKTYITDAGPEQLKEMADNNFEANDGVYVSEDGQNVNLVESEDDISVALFGMDTDRFAPGPTTDEQTSFDAYMDLFNEQRALGDSE